MQARLATGLVTTLVLACAGVAHVDGQDDPASTEETTTMDHARGEFDVSLAPLALDGPVPDEKFARMSIDKVYRGELDATGTGQMLTAMTDVEGSAAYVAIERVAGELAGRRGSFALQHSGTMAGGSQELRIRVVPDSGTGDLTGIRGELEIRIEGERHFYDFAYELP